MAKLIGTAGHVDHGKTTLIRALTGIDADRLPEEKRRGMSIDIGFAYIDLPGHGRVSIVDVPGHERFLANMLVGALGIDVALLCVAADESVMPQTREHLQILDLLPVDRLVVALTRADLADAAMREISSVEIGELLSQTRFAEVPILVVSAETGEGLEALRSTLSEALDAAEAVSAPGGWYLPIDRAFSIKGYGTVVTGTLARGAVREGEAATILPGDFSARVRGIRRHNEPLAVGKNGMRLALNLGGVRLEDLRRGQAVGAPGAMFESSIIDARMRWLVRPKHAQRVRVSIGADEVIAKVFHSDLDPAVAQLRIEVPVAAAIRQPLIVRRYSPPDLLGGGQVLVPQAILRRKGDPIPTVEVDDPSEGILQMADRGGASTEAICRALGQTPQGLGETFEALKSSGRLLGFAGLWFTHGAFEAKAGELLSALRALHDANPSQAAQPRERVVAAAKLDWAGKPLDRILGHLAASGRLVVRGSEIALPDFRVRLNERQQELLARLEQVLDEAGANVPSEDEIARTLAIPPQAAVEIVRLGVEAGRLVRVGEGIHYTTGGLESIKREIAGLAAHGAFAASEVRDRLATSRKYVIPLLEYLDAVQFTLRQGDKRILR
ncbi:MAG TPA: selenocysteine-specific translation elongation factor [Fimbriimonadaceae bacterium]|nr:selenocysteine-specific translation elongation factor [Fimbriimonadaceae bacterium]HRJ96528.1 selenocysteine-specific translation elongation factor [Fimbriimonadaceae bacterium]